MVNILIVDDNENIRKLIRIYLEREGYHVYCASDGIETLNALENRPIHLAIVDIMMSKMDGCQLTSELKKNGYKMPI